MNDFSVYYQVYNNISLTTKVLNSFRNIYPNIQIQLLCDKGIDYSELANEMNCEYVYSNYHTGIWGWNHKDVISGKHCYGWTKEEALEHISRWYSFAKKINTKYILTMEDDVYVTNKISMIDYNFHFTQVAPGNQLNDKLKQIARKFNINHTIDKYGCCGGHFINRELYIECVDNCLPFIEQYYDQMINAEFHLGWPDTLNNLIFNLCGYIGIENIDYHEGFENPKNKAIFHDHNGRVEKWKKYDTIDK